MSHFRVMSGTSPPSERPVPLGADSARALLRRAHARASGRRSPRSSPETRPPHMISRVIASSVFHATRVVALRLSTTNRRLPSGGFVSFTFDDFPTSAAREGTSLVESVGARATFYASMSITKPDDVARVAERGHEVGCHTYSHLDCFRASDAE